MNIEMQNNIFIKNIILYYIILEDFKKNIF